MTYIDARLSDLVAFGFSGGPEWSTRIVPLENGQEQRNGQWRYPRYRFKAQYLNFREEARNDILAAFNAARGRLYAFRFKDYNDFIARAERVYPTAGTRDAVQLIKTYPLGPVSTPRKIQAPVAGAATVYDHLANPVPGTLDTSVGLFVPATAWGNGPYTWSGEFDVWVRFDSDYNAFTIGNRSGDEYVATAEIELLEVRR
ncbi:hypothetical protein ADT25_10990 [Xanthomonas oryzae]|uniref:DUF2460 domain-containing protein n=1 Tax=Xanthomonas oryzae TaxID=347 RepID=A0AAP0ZKV1_9XANT|nr:DUF2460 domain-containing protein [Xanthomonas oryzae]KOR44274.1 hypothetical protein ADT25_10990 [Xanthomonas oryzae]QBG85848.1 hypothetical protein EYR27_21290 [Xanthomonas oryzae]